MSAQTLEHLFQAYLGEKRFDVAASTHYQRSLFYRAVLRDLGAVPLAEVTPDLLRGWKADLSARYRRSTVHTYLSFLGQAFTFAVECEWLAVNPLAKVRKPSPGPGRVRFLSELERTRLLMACRMSRNPLLYPLVAVALGTGGRKNELRYLRWEDVDFQSGVLRFIKTKTGRPRSVPLVGEAREVLEGLAQRRRPGVSLVFARADGKAPREIEGAWTTARRIADIQDFHFHDLRHTFASYMAMSGASLRDIAECLGHVKLQQTLAYSHLLPSHTTAVVARMVQQFLPPSEPQSQGA